MTKRGWLTQDSIPDRVTLAISLPNDEQWRAQFLGAFLLLTQSENWEDFGNLTSQEMALEWLDIWLEFVGGETSMIPVGCSLEYSGTTLPGGFLWEDGEEISRTTYANLFAVIGTTFGDGDGSTTFNKPNRMQKMSAGYDAGNGFFDELGKTGGNEWHTLVVSELPIVTVLQNPHTHVQNSHTHIQDGHTHTIDGGINAASGAVGRSLIAQGLGSNNTLSRSTTPTNQNTTPTNQNTTPTNQSFGGGLPHPNMPPYIVKNFIIKY